MTRDPDPRNELGKLAPENEQRCTDSGVVFARQRAVADWRRPLLITSVVPLATVACDGLCEAHQRLAAEGARLAVRETVLLDTGAALGHCDAPVLNPVSLTLE